MGSPVQPEINWKKNLFFIWLSQVLSLMAFSFAMSFAAYYIQDLGITDPKELKFWNGAFAASAPLSMAVMGPIWGMIGDRVGRRLMMLRAYFCATIIIFFSAIARRFDMAFVPLVVQELNNGVLAGSATRMGKLTACCCVTMTVASLSVGYMVDKISPRVIIAMAAIGAATFAFMQYTTETFMALVAFRCGMMFFVGGMEPAFQTWLSRNTPEGARGGVFGFSNTFKALGWSCASICSTGVAMSYGIRSTFVIASILFMVMVPLVFIGIKRGGG